MLVFQVTLKNEYKPKNRRNQKMKNNLDNVFNLFLAAIITLVVCMVFGIKEWVLILVIFALSYPWKIKGNIWSLFGGGNFSGSVYSLIPIIQVSNKDCVGVLSPFCVQIAAQDAGLVFGFSPLQTANSAAWACFGIIFSQHAGSDEAGLACGIVFNQTADKGAVVMGGIALRQCAKEAYIGFGIPLIQKAEKCGCDWEKASKMLDELG